MLLLLVVVELSTLVAASGALSYFYRKNKKLHDSILSHVKRKYPKEYKELSIKVIGDNMTVLGARIRKDSKYLPHDHYLDKKYEMFRKDQQRLWKITLVVIIAYIVYLAIRTAIYF